MDAEERALLAAIIANPDDDTVRLVYADWLDERADQLPVARRVSACVKAELIRLQIESAGLILGAPDFDPRYEVIERRTRELAAYHQAWVDELEGVTPARGLRFVSERGLFGEVVCSVRYFVQHGKALFAAAPVTAIRLKMLSLSNVKALASCPHLAKIRILKVYVGDTPHEALFAMLERVPLAHLKGLVFDNWLGNHGFTEDATPLAERVAGCAKLAKLKRLSFYAAGIGSDGGRALAASEYLRDLEVLDLRGNTRMLAKATVRKRFGKRVWLDYDDVQGFPIGYQFAN